MKRLKRILSPKIYFPGLISILVLPIASYLYLRLYQIRYAIPVSWFDQRAVKRLDSVYHQRVSLEKFRKYERLYLTGSKAEDKLELDKLSGSVQLLTTKYGLTNGICVCLTAKTKYQDIVTALDVCRYYKVLSVVPVDDKIFVFKYNNVGDILWKQKDVRLPPDAFGPHDLLGPPQDSKSIADDLLVFWPCLIPFAGMIYFWRKRNKWAVE